MSWPRLRRRWVVVAIVVVLTFGVFRLLDQPLPLQSYTRVDPQTIEVVGVGGNPDRAWTHVTGLTETDASVTISVNSLYVQLGPSTAAGYFIPVRVRLSAPLGQRAVIDGATGGTLRDGSSGP